MFSYSEGGGNAPHHPCHLVPAGDNCMDIQGLLAKIRRLSTRSNATLVAPYIALPFFIR
jgi:hypothetical protein